jgi:hypothetical protein
MISPSMIEAHLKPIDFVNWPNWRPKSSAPIALPAIATPVAKPRLFSKYSTRTINDVLNIHPDEMPLNSRSVNNNLFLVYTSIILIIPPITP